MKVLLVLPGFPCVYEKQKPREPPLGLSILATILEKENHNILCFNEDVDSRKNLISLIKKFQPDIVGLTFPTVGAKPSSQLANKIKKINPKIITIAGGFGLSCDPKKVMDFGGFDIGVIGEGEITFSELTKAIENKKPIKNIKGLIYKKNNKIITTKPRGLIQDLDSLPYPAFHYFDLKKYGKCLPIYTSRGCPYSCIYCTANVVVGKKFRPRSPKKIVDEIEYLKHRYNRNEFSIVDDNFAFNKKRAKEICDEIIKRKLNIRWECSQGIRPDVIDRDILKKMKKSGCTMIGLGIETINPKSIKALKRGSSLEKIKQVVKDAKDVGIIVKTFNLIGSPYETYQDIIKNIKFNKKLGVDIFRFTSLVSFPNTELEMWSKKHAIPNKNYNVYNISWKGEDHIENEIPYETKEFSIKERLKAYDITRREVEKQIIRFFMKKRIGKLIHIIDPLLTNKYSRKLIRKTYLHFLRGKMDLWD